MHMLFRTVYGPELKSLYQYICSSREPLSRQHIIKAFIPTSKGGENGASPQNVEDGLSFLVSSHLIEEHEGFFVGNRINAPFPLALLKNLRDVERGTLQSRHPLDPQYSALLHHLFMSPDLLYSDNLHARANSIEDIKKLGGISKEKIQAWKRVMEYLGLGYRINRGFMCAIAPALLMPIIETLPEGQVTLQRFFEHTLDRFIPYLNSSGDVAQPIRQPLLYLAEIRQIELSPLQDSPHKAYFQPNNLRQIKWERAHATA